MTEFNFNFLKHRKRTISTIAPVARRTDLYITIDELEAGLEIAKKLIDQRDQVCVTSEPNVSDPLYYNYGRIKTVHEPICSYLNPEFKGTVFEKILKHFNCETSRARIMKLKPRACYSFHVDRTPRYHLVLQSTSSAFFYFENHPVFHLPKDQHVYWLDTRVAHTAFNCSLEERYHFVFVDSNAGGLST